MKKLFFLATIAMTMVACQQEKNQQDAERAAAQATIDSLKAVNANQAQELEDFMGLVDQVNEGFRLIKEAEGRIDISDGNMERGNKQQIAANMEFIQQTMKQNHELIDQLKQKLSSSSKSLSSLTKQIQALEQQMADQDNRIKELQMQLAERDVVIEEQGKTITQLNENVSNLTNENEQKAAEVAAQDKELNTAWYVFGTKNELKEQRILDSGDVLKNGNFNKGYFTQIDIRHVKNIRLYSKSAKLLTNHPTSSYQLAKNSNGEYELQITDPSLFWSVSKYLVVQVK